MKVEITKALPWTVPRGRFMCCPAGLVGLEVRDSDGQWQGAQTAAGSKLSFPGGMVAGDAQSVRLVAQEDGGAVLHVAEVPCGR